MVQQAVQHYAARSPSLRRASRSIHLCQPARLRPGIGAAPLGSLGSQRERYPANTNLQCYTGVAPVTKGAAALLHPPTLSVSKVQPPSFHEYAKEEFCGAAGRRYYLNSAPKAVPTTPACAPWLSMAAGDLKC